MFKQIPNLKNYLVNKDGVVIQKLNQEEFMIIDGEVYRVKNQWFNINKKTTNTKKGYKCISVTEDGIKRNLYVHSLVYRTFVGDIPGGYEINHIDHNKHNNVLNNLEIVTRGENMIKMGEFYRTTPKKSCKQCGRTVRSSSVYCPKCRPLDENGKRLPTPKELENAKRSKERSKKPSKDILENEIINFDSSIVSLAKKYGVSQSPFKKWLKGYDLPFRRKDIERYKLEYKQRNE